MKTRSLHTPSTRRFPCLPLLTLALSALQLFSPSAFSQTAHPPKAAFRVLHSNDVTNLSRFHGKGPLEDGHIRASVDEINGFDIDVHMIEVWGWVPWWQSDILPIAGQAAWKKSKDIKLDTREAYTLNGGDLLRVFVEQCRKSGQSPFVSFRMNDQHHLHPLREPAGRKLADIPEAEISRKAAVCPFYVDNPQWRIGDDGTANLMGQLSMDFAVPQVREYRLKQIRELVNKYDIDGLQLDFLRHRWLFNQGNTKSRQRVQIITGMIRQVREILDAKGARAGRHLWLALRIPAWPELYNEMGIDPPALANEAGVDIINASTDYNTDPQAPVAQLRKMLPARVALHVEMHYTCASGPNEKLPGGKTSRASRRLCTPLQLLTTTYLARQRGADGMSTFNFQYYRGVHTGEGVFGTPAESPYDVFRKTSDLDWLARLPQHYIASGNNNGMRPKNRQFPVTFPAGEWKKVFMDMTPPAGGWRADGKMRIQARASLDGSTWGARLNGVWLQPVNNVAESFPNPYPDAQGTPSEYRAWLVPAALLKDGENIFEISYEGKAKSMSLYFMDVALPGPASLASQ